MSKEKFGVEGVGPSQEEKQLREKMARTERLLNPILEMISKRLDGDSESVIGMLRERIEGNKDGRVVMSVREIEMYISKLHTIAEDAMRLTAIAITDDSK